MRVSEQNPFVPGETVVPDIWIDRPEATLAFSRARKDRLRGRYSAGFVAVGESGVGKSALVNRLTSHGDAADDLRLGTVRLSKGDDPIALLAVETARAARGVASGKLSAALAGLVDRLEISVLGVVKAGPKQPAPDPNPHITVRDTLIELAATIARENFAGGSGHLGRLLTIRIDEMQNASEQARSQLMTVLADLLVAERELPVGGTNHTRRVHLPVQVLVTGLPHFLNTTSTNDTFRTRFTTHRLTHFGDGEIEDAILDQFPYVVDPAQPDDAVTFAASALDELIRIVAGDPFAFQLVGKAAWDAGTGAEIVLAEVEQAEQTTYRARSGITNAALRGLPDGERALLETIVELAVPAAGRVEIPALTTQLGRPSATFGSTLSRLDNRGIVERVPGGLLVRNRLVARTLTSGDIAVPAWPTDGARRP